METRRPLVVDIRSGSLEDGPGIRTVVFFKGCPLRCVFCHNPETQRAEPEIAFAAGRCLGCGSCREACERGAIGRDGPSTLDRQRCDICGRCADACPVSALRVIGRYWPVCDLADRLLRDEPFYRHSGGGVTLSGGECTMHPAYLGELLPMLRERRIHVALETSGEFGYEAFARHILPYLDLILFDVKLIDPGASQVYTGRSNARMLANLERLIKDGRCPVRPRVPVVPGVTDSEENLRSIVDRLCDLGAATVSLLPYNPLGLAMHAQLGRPCPDLSTRLMRGDEEESIVGLLREIIAARAAAPADICRTTRGA